jgi:TldD protein
LKRREFLEMLAGGAVAAGLIPWPSWAAVQGGAATALPYAGAPQPPVLPREDVEAVFRAAAEKGSQFTEIYLEYRASTDLGMEDGKLNRAATLLTLGAGVRVFAGERVGYATTEVLERGSLVEAARTAATVAERAKEGRAVAAVGSQRLTPGGNVFVQQPFNQIAVTEKSLFLVRATKAAQKAGSAVGRVKAEYHETEQAVAIYNSLGLFASGILPMITLRVTAVARKGSRQAEGYHRAAARRGLEIFAENSPEAIGKIAAEQALTLLEAREAPAGNMPVVVGNQGGLLFHEAIGHGLEGDGIVEKTSFFTELRGSKVAGELVTLSDDPTLRSLHGSYDMDDEGTPATRTVLIERGKLVGFLWDRRFARRANAKSTGNGRRQSFEHPPLPRMSNTVLAPGDVTPEDIVRSTKRGLYAKAFRGGVVDQVSGTFTFHVQEGYLIEDGKITAPVVGASLVGKGVEVLRNIDLVGNDVAFWAGNCGKGGQWVPVTTGAPSLRLAEITVGGTEQS